MPRRSFFRAGGDKKNKQERKLQQKIQRQQAQIEPPQNLSGPPQNAPPRLAGHPYDNYVSDVQYHASSTSNTQQSQGNPSSGARRAEGNEDGQIQQKNGEQLPQHYHYQNNNGHLVPTHAAFPNQHHQYEDNVQNQLQQQQQQRQQQIYGQHDPQHNTANQQFPQQHDSSPQNNHRQQQQYEYPQNIVHPESIPQHQNLVQPSQSAQQPPHPGVIITQNIAPTVDSATDEIWRCESDDFRSASHAIQMLRLAIVAEWEQQRMLDREAIEGGRSGNNGRASSPRDTRGRNNNNHSHRPSTSTSPFSYDPPETFLCLQGAALRFHARFEAMQAERSAKVDDQKQESERVDRATVVDLYEEKNQQQQSQHFDPMGDHSLEWELTEQAAWEVWEESVRASAALAHACVGPAWRRQLKLRRQLIQEAEIRLRQQPHLQNRSRFRDTDSVGSSVGGVSSTSNISMDFSNPQAGRFLPGPQMNILDTSARTMMPDDLAGSVVIPEVLPAAMIRFAASAIETSVPPLRNASTKIFWESEKSGISSGGNEPLLNTLGRHLHDERRWLRRRKRLGCVIFFGLLSCNVIIFSYTTFLHANFAFYCFNFWV